MFQRLLVRQGQVARAALSHSTSTPLALRRTSQLQPGAFQAIRPLAPQQSLRCYSTEKPTDKGEQKDAEETESAESPEDAVRKQIEKKEAEVRDLKVVTIHELL